MAGSKVRDVHKALADDTRYRLYRYIGLAGRPVSVREMSRRLGLHPNTLRPHLRRLEDAGLIASESQRTSAVGRPQTMYAIREAEDEPAGDYRLLAEMLATVVRGKRQLGQALELARQWGAWMVAQDSPKPGVRVPARRNLALLQEAMAKAGFEPRFRRVADGSIEVTLRDCPFRELAEEHRELACTLHRGLLEGMTEAVRPPLALRELQPFVERTVCRALLG
jgi:predicted ArsR family transcriptional regulator